MLGRSLGLHRVRTTDLDTVEIEEAEGHHEVVNELEPDIVEGEAERTDLNVSNWIPIGVPIALVTPRNKVYFCVLMTICDASDHIFFYCYIVIFRMLACIIWLNGSRCTLRIEC